jgi:sodium transport system permease protein
MRWSTVFVIFRREVRDQLRDKRTLFMIFVLPILLYPLLGIGAFKYAEIAEQKLRTVVIVGPEFLPAEPPLLKPDGTGFHRSLFDSDAEASRLVVEPQQSAGPWLDPKFREETTRSGRAYAVVTLPKDLRQQIEQKKKPQISIDYDSADEGSQNTFLRLDKVVDRWQRNIVEGRLKQDKLPQTYTEPLKVKPVDVATEAEVGSSVWAKLFPFLLVMMSLTGAFYPAVDICAGEKERGTMETLLISPASRAEIVMGKFLTVMLASVMTALLNIICMGLTGMQLARMVAAGRATTGAAAAASTATSKAAMIAPPSVATIFWIILLLIPLAAFFSALCLSLAVLARSMKEGQYYMTPLYMVSLPLIFVTLTPEIELNLFYSLLPITGVSLLLRALIQGNYGLAGRFFVPVLMMTIAYGVLALRWAIDQFQREDVLFREAERFDLRMWLRHLLRDKEPTPTAGEAVFCFAVMLSMAWFLTQYQLLAGGGHSTAALATGQIVYVLTPPLAMALLLTASPRRTLRLYAPSAGYVAIAAGLAFAINPLVGELHFYVDQFFPISRELKEALENLMKNVPNLPTALLLFAVIPAICEELAFRGFILSGLERSQAPRTAIIMSALLFGFMHVLISLFQQLFNATLLGLILGVMAVRSRSILPGIVFHMMHNGLAVALGTWLAGASASGLAGWLYRDRAHGLYQFWLVALSVVLTAWLLSLLRAPKDGHHGAEDG